MSRAAFPPVEEPELLTIAEAASRLHAKVTASALHSARRSGRLWATKIGKCYFTTWPAIMEFLQCPAPESPPGYTSEKMNNNGSFVTGAPSNGQAMALASVSKLKGLCKNTSQIESRPPAEVRPIRGS